jgi:hypothetical protein
MRPSVAVWQTATTRLGGPARRPTAYDVIMSPAFFLRLLWKVIRQLPLQRIVQYRTAEY